ncbi:O-succinylbenzoate synthase [Pseudonocardiaceae bacterium YIM PH 21723]|nr:O-succinylbenzoate synthase [Pseudonocardiaceae bacterium YIM PH 21723]
MIDWSSARYYSIPMRTRFRGITVREGVVFPGPRGWGEFCPFDDYSDEVSARWLATAVEAATQEWPAAVRTRIPINCTVPVVSAERAYELVKASGCGTAKVKVADHPESLPEDEERVAAVRDALGPAGRIRVDANAVWDVDTAAAWIRRLDRAADGLEYVEQPCRTIDDLVAVRRKVDVRIAADEVIRLTPDPLRVDLREAADVAVLKCTPLGGVRRALKVAEAIGLPCVVSSALETSVGLSAQLALAGALPELDFACGLGTTSLFTGDLVAGGFVPEQGHLRVPSSPLVPETELLDTFAMTGPRLSYWQERLNRVRALL